MKPTRRGVALIAAAAVTLGLAPGPAAADAGAAALIQGWSRALGAGTSKQVIITATQGGSPGGGPVSFHAAGTLTRAADGSLVTGRTQLIFSDRKASIPGRPIQPFDASRADVAEFTLTTRGDLVVRSITWSSIQTVGLQSIGNQMLGGWGDSIGNLGVPSRWTIGVSPQNDPIAG